MAIPRATNDIAASLKGATMGGNVKRMYIDGEWVLAETDATFAVVNPADRSIVARVTNAGAPESERAVQAAHRAFLEWSQLAPKDRARFLLSVQEGMNADRDRLARLVSLENGKPLEEARKEVEFAAGYFGWFAKASVRVEDEWVDSPNPAKRYVIRRQPVGPVVAITPWNFPATMVTR